MHLLKYGCSPLARNAWRNRQELIAAGLCTRRDLLKLGLLTTTGMLLAKHGLSARASDGGLNSPPTRAFVEPLPIMPVKRPLPNGVNDLNPYPTIMPNNVGGEGRTRQHQAYVNYPRNFSWPPKKVFEVTQKFAPLSVSPDLPLQQTWWGFDGISPGPTYHARYGEPMLVRNRNELPLDNKGFGMRSVTTHLHNAHTPSESDGFPGDYFPNPDNPSTKNAWFYDHNYPNVLAGFASTHPPYGDINESLSTCWYHDHRVGFTAQNVYKGLAGFYLLWNDEDCGDETNPNGYGLPGVRDPNDFYAPVKYDIPLMLMDKVFDPGTGQMFFDLFNFDGIIGDKYLVNGKVQPYLEVEPRRYRFRVLDAGPSRFYQLFLTDKGTNTSIPFWQVAMDGNLMVKPCKVNSIPLGVAERIDVCIDFRPWAGKTLYFENRLAQDDGRGPNANMGTAGSVVAPGQGNFLLQFRVGTRAVEDNSIDYENQPAGYQCYSMPSRPTPRLNRTFRFERSNNLWMINGKPFPDDALTVHFRVKQNSAEMWTLVNKSGGWMHPIHIHFEEFQLIRRNGVPVLPGSYEYSRKDVIRMQHGEENTAIWRFRDFEGRYPMHCHNVVHEDHAMMLRWDIDQTGDTKSTP